MGTRGIGYAITANEKVKILYGLFALLAVASIILATSNVGYLGFLIPGALLTAYLKKIKWVDLLKIYLAILFLVPKASYKMLGGLPMDIDPSRVFATLLLFLWLSLLLIDPSFKIKRTGLEAPLFAFLFFLFVTIVLNLDLYTFNELSASLKSVLLFLTYIFVFYIIVSTTKKYSEVESLIKWLAFLCILISFFGIIERFTDYNVFRHLHQVLPFLKVNKDEISQELIRGNLRISGPADHPIALAALLPMFLPLIFALFYNSKSAIKKIWYAAGIAVTITASFFTVSATALVGIIVVLISQIILNPRRGFVLLLIIVLFAVCANALLSEDFQQVTKRISYKYILSNEVGNENGRLADYPKVWRRFSERPLFGMGLGTFDPKKYFYLDNQYLGLIIETGLVGTLSFLWFLFALIRRLKRTISQQGRDTMQFASALLSSVTVFAVASATFDTFGFSDVVYAFFILASLGVSLYTNNPQESTGVSSMLPSDMPISGGL